MSHKIYRYQRNLYMLIGIIIFFYNYKLQIDY